MKFKDVEQKAKDEIQGERERAATELVKSRLHELERSRKVAAKLEKQYAELLEMDIEDQEFGASH